MVQLVVALRVERLALVGCGPVARSGMGPERAARAASRLGGDGPLAVLGLCGGLTGEVAPGTLLVASEVRGPDGVVPCTAPEALGAALGARVGPLVSSERIVRGGAARAALAADGALAVDMESYWLAGAAAGRPLAVVRGVVDVPGRELLRPLATASAALRALRALRAAVPALERWAHAAPLTF
ncbi:MAG TPA: hypothetical protein VHX88_04280 [Solirubrobacteraceae bacterium]|jgi:4-hydroxy-3-methylbut-2-enyl diphosphate reductase|nr:hypothetical protein [Solirubrobacteraceae bacterium]